MSYRQKLHTNPTSTPTGLKPFACRGLKHGGCCADIHRTSTELPPNIHRWIDARRQSGYAYWWMSGGCLVDVEETSTAPESLCRKAFRKISVDVGLFPDESYGHAPRVIRTRWPENTSRQKEKHTGSGTECAMKSPALVRCLPTRATGASDAKVRRSLDSSKHSANIFRNINRVSLGSLTPQGFLLPIAGEPHSEGTHSWESAKQFLYFTDERVVLINPIQPVGDATDDGIRGLRIGKSIYPISREMGWKLWHSSHFPIPNTSMMRTHITQGVYSTHPTLHCSRFRNTKTSRNPLFDRCVVEITIEMEKTAKRSQLKHLPCWRKETGVVFGKMFFNKILLGSFKFMFESGQIFCEHKLINPQSWVEKPEWTVSEGEIMDNPRTQGYLNLLNSAKENFTQLIVKEIQGGSLLKGSPSMKQMVFLPNFENMQIGIEAEVADIVEELLGGIQVTDDETALLKHGDLVLNGKSILNVFHNLNLSFQKKSTQAPEPCVPSLYTGSGSECIAKKPALVRCLPTRATGNWCKDRKKCATLQGSQCLFTIN